MGLITTEILGACWLAAALILQVQEDILTRSGRCKGKTEETQCCPPAPPPPCAEASAPTPTHKIINVCLKISTAEAFKINLIANTVCSLAPAPLLSAEPGLAAGLSAGQWEDRGLCHQRDLASFPALLLTHYVTLGKSLASEEQAWGTSTGPATCFRRLKEQVSPREHHTPGTQETLVHS